MSGVVFEDDAYEASRVMNPIYAPTYRSDATHCGSTLDDDLWPIDDDPSWNKDK